MIINPIIDNDKNSREWRITLSSDAIENTKIIQSEFLKQNYSNPNLLVAMRAQFEVQMPETVSSVYGFAAYAHNEPIKEKCHIKMVRLVVQNDNGAPVPNGGVATEVYLNSERILDSGCWLHLNSDGSLLITGTETQCFPAGDYIVTAFIFEDTSNSNLLATMAPPMLMATLQASTDDEEEEIIGEN